MDRKGRRQIVFVCATIGETQELIIDIIPAASTEEAASLFIEKYKIKTQSILGPFLKKKTKILETTRLLKFDGQPRQAVYDGWIVNAFLLKEPQNQAFLIFLKREDEQKKQPPKGTIIVPISDLRFTNV